MKRPAGETGEEAAAEDEDDGRSTAFWVVIAIVLAIPVLLVVTVVAAAVIGAFVLGLGDDASAQPPQVSWEGSYAEDAGTVSLTHSGGEVVQTDRIEVSVDGERADWSGPDERISAGDQITVNGVESGQVVRVVWTSPEGDSSVVAEHRAVAT